MDDKNLETSTLNEHIMQIVEKKHPKTVKQLVELVHQKHPLPQQKIIEHILNLQNQGKLTFKEDKTLIPTTLKSYISSSHSFWYWATIALTLATTVSVFTIPESAYPIVYARHLLGSILVLFLPGYSLIKALFPTRELDNIERAVLSVVMSITVVPITALLLNYTPWGIRITPVMISLIALTTTLATVAIIREQQAKLKENQ